MSRTRSETRVMPVLSAHCTTCHGGEKPKAKLNLSGPRSRDQLRAEAGQWLRVLEQIESGVMPPESRKPLSPAERQAVAGWVRGELADWLASEHLKEGRSKFRRLNRAEYANTIHDLFGIRPPVVRDLPVDGRVDGYDKLSTALPFSSASAAGYLKITEEILSRFLLPSPAKQDRTFRLGAGPSEQSKGHILELPDGTMVSFNTDTTSGPLRKRTPDGKFQGFPGPRIPGLHRLRLSVYAYQTDKPLTFGIYAGHVWAYPQMIELLKVLEAPPGKPTVLETEVYLRTGRDSDLSIDDGIRLIPFGLGVPVPKNSLASKCTAPGLAVQWVDVEEPELPLPGDRWLCSRHDPGHPRGLPATRCDVVEYQVASRRIAGNGPEDIRACRRPIVPPRSHRNGIVEGHREFYRPHRWRLEPEDRVSSMILPTRSSNSKRPSARSGCLRPTRTWISIATPIRRSGTKPRSRSRPRRSRRTASSRCRRSSRSPTPTKFRSGRFRPARISATAALRLFWPAASCST